MLGMNFPKLFQRDVSSYVCGILYLDPSASLKRIFAFPVGGLFRPSTCLSTCSRSLFFTAAHFQLALVAASICHFVTAATKFSCCSVPTKNVSSVFFVCLSVFFFFYFSLQISFALFLVEFRWPVAYFLFFSVFLLLYIPNLWTLQLI